MHVVQKYMWFRFLIDPIFSADPIIFFNVIDRVTHFLRAVAGC
jgi:hypothetical protein